MARIARAPRFQPRFSPCSERKKKRTDICLALSILRMYPLSLHEKWYFVSLCYWHDKTVDQNKRRKFIDVYCIFLMPDFCRMQRCTEKKKKRIVNGPKTRNGKIGIAKSKINSGQTHSSYKFFRRWFIIARYSP